MTTKEPAEKVVRDIRRRTRRQYSSEEKSRIVLEGLRGEESIAALCRREGIAESLYYKFVQGVSASRKEAAHRRHQTAGNDHGGPRSASGESEPERVGRRIEPGEPPAEKKACSVMGAATHEIPGIREARDHPPG